MRRFRGIGLLVSHDRAMLDELCGQCLFLDPPYPAVLRPGGYTKGYEQTLADNERARVMRDKAKQEVRQVRRNMAERRERAAREHKVRSKRGLAKKDHDSRAQINAGRLTDSKAGASLRQVQGRMRHAEQHLAGIHVKKQTELGFWLPQSRSKMDYLLNTEPGTLTIGDAGDANAPKLQLPVLRVRPDDRIAITGPNGAGKSTLIRYLMQHLLLPRDRVMLMPQEISVGESETIIRQVRQTPPNELGRLMNVISRLGSDPNRLLQTALPSPGEVRKMLLAIGVVRGASLIVMDEPTNHLDLPSIRCLEDALAECPCALVLVSHDEAFLKRLTTTRWDLFLEEGEGRMLKVKNGTPSEDL
ncbi:MAG: ATP-binding cassette domain-containing protein [Phycisphaerales bacterium]